MNGVLRSCASWHCLQRQELWKYSDTLTGKYLHTACTAIEENKSIRKELNKIARIPHTDKVQLHCLTGSIYVTIQLHSKHKKRFCQVLLHKSICFRQ